MSDVFRLIEENGLQLHGDIEHFAELVAIAERAACIRACHDQLKPFQIVDSSFNNGVRACVQAIEDRGDCE